MHQRFLVKLAAVVVFGAVAITPGPSAASESSGASLGPASGSSSSLEDLHYRLFDSRVRALSGFAIGSLAGLLIGARRKQKLEEGEGS